MKNTIVMGFDENYAPAAVVALFSLFCNTTRRDFDVCIFVDNVSSASITYFDELSKIFNRSIRLVDMKASQFEGLNVNTQITRAAYSRLIAPNEIKTDRMIWLDCDLIVHDDIGFLLDFEIPKFAIAAGVRDMPVEKGRKNALNLPETDIYINSGVMIIDAAKWRKENLSEKAIETWKIESERFIYWDQCLINKVIESRKAEIPEKWNKMYHSYSLNRMSGITPIDPNFKGIVHYTTPTKPWHIWSDRKYARLYKNYASIAPTRMKISVTPNTDRDRQDFINRLTHSDY